MITRKEYLENSSELHHKYYMQFVNTATVSHVKKCIGLDNILNSQNEHFNDIPLWEWDACIGWAGSRFILRHPLLPYNQEKLVEAHGNRYYSCSDMICIAKAAASYIKEMETLVRDIDSQ